MGDAAPEAAAASDASDHQRDGVRCRWRGPAAGERRQPEMPCPPPPGAPPPSAAGGRGSCGGIAVEDPGRRSLSGR